MNAQELIDTAKMLVAGDKLCIIEQRATGLRAAASTMPQWREYENDQ